MVQTFAALGDELSDRGIFGCRFKEFEAALADGHHDQPDLFLLDGLFG